MQALLLTDYRRLELTAVERPIVGPEDVLISVQSCGICGSDVHGYDGSSGRRIPPLVMGHEAAGVIAEVGSAVERFQIGDRVTFDSTISCGHCGACLRGDVNLCANRRVLGVACAEYRQHGAFAEFVVVPQNVVYSIPTDLSYDEAALLEPVSVALHAAQRVQIEPGDCAVVIGTGMIGLLVVQALRVADCREVIAVDIDASRLELARELGASVAINAAETHARDLIVERTNGQCADVAMEVVGNAVALNAAINCVRRGGRVGLVGNLAAEVSFPLQSVVTREITLYGSCASAGDYPRAIELVSSGAINVKPLISAVAPLAEGPQWFERLHAREPGLMKVVLKPTSESTTRA